MIQLTTWEERGVTAGIVAPSDCDELGGDDCDDLLELVATLSD